MSKETDVKTIICDIDGTLMNIDHRRHFVEKPNNDWESFNSAMDGDTPNKWCAEIISGLCISDGFSVVFVTGREQKYREITKEQIIKAVHFYRFDLFLRPTGDYRPDTEIKKEIYECAIKNYYDVLFAIDDRACVVKMWRSLGLTCLQCTEGNFQEL